MKSETVLIFLKEKWTLDKKLLIQQLDEAWGPSDGANSSNTAAYVVHLHEKKAIWEKKQHEKKGKKKKEKKEIVCTIRKNSSQKNFF